MRTSLFSSTILKDFRLLTVGLESSPIKTITFAFSLFIGTRFPPYYRVIDPIAGGKYAISLTLMGQFQSAFTANLLSIMDDSRNRQNFGNLST